MHPTGTFVPDFAIHSHLQQLSRKQFSSPYVSTEVHVVGSPILPLAASNPFANWKWGERQKGGSKGHSYKGLLSSELKNTIPNAYLGDRFIVCPKSSVD